MQRTSALYEFDRLQTRDFYAHASKGYVIERSNGGVSKSRAALPSSVTLHISATLELKLRKFLHLRSEKLIHNLLIGAVGR